MSLIGKIGTGAIVGAELLDIVRYTSAPIESLGVRAQYGEDGVGWGLVPIPEEPVDPEKLEFGIGVSPVIIFGKDEVCVGVNVGVGYEVKFLACHRSEPVEEPSPSNPFPPPSDPPDGGSFSDPFFPSLPDDADVLFLYFEDDVVQKLQVEIYGTQITTLSQTRHSLEQVEFKDLPDGTQLLTVVARQHGELIRTAGGAIYSQKSVSVQKEVHRYDPQTNSMELLYRKQEGLLQDSKGTQQRKVGDIAILYPRGKWGDLKDYLQSSVFKAQAVNRPWGIGYENSIYYRPLSRLRLSFDGSYSPPPTNSLPFDKCEEMKCCDNKDTEELVRLIARNLGVTTTGYFMEVPRSVVTSESSLFGKIDNSESVKIKSQAEFNAYLLQALNAISGQFEVTIDVPARLSKATKGEAERVAGTITIPDLANGLAIIVKLLLNLQDDEGDMRSFLTRILLETHLSRRSAARAADEAYNLRLWTGMKVQEEAAMMPCTFSPPQDIAGRDIDQIDTDAEVKDFLRESKVPYKRIKYADRAGFKEVVHQLLQGVAILRAVFGIRFDSKSSTKDQMKTLVRQTHSNAQGKPTQSPSAPDVSDDDFKKFVKDQAKKRGIVIDFVGEKK